MVFFKLWQSITYETMLTRGSDLFKWNVHPQRLAKLFKVDYVIQKQELKYMYMYVKGHLHVHVHVGIRNRNKGSRKAVN